MRNFPPVDFDFKQKPIQHKITFKYLIIILSRIRDLVNDFIKRLQYFVDLQRVDYAG